MPELARSITALQRELLADVAEFDRAEAWRGDGAVSMTAWLTERCGVSGATARMWARTAANLESHPRLTQAFGEGSLSLEVLAPLSEVATPATDRAWAREAVHWSVKQARELAASHKVATDVLAARQFEHRTLRLNDARCTIWASLTKDDYASVKARLVAAVRSRDDWDVPIPGPGGFDAGGSSAGPGSAGPGRAGPGKVGPGRAGPGRAGPGKVGPGKVDGTVVGSSPRGYTPFDQRLCDVFVDLFRPVEITPAVGRSSSSVHERSLRSSIRPTVVVHADFGWLTGTCGCGCGEIAGLGTVSRQVARRLACDAKIIFSLEARDGSILDQKRLRRNPTTAQRIEIARRDKGCRFPSCSFIDFTEVHHVHPWELGGETNQSNLLTLCGRHHRAVHELGWTLKGNADGVMTFTGPHGHAMTSTPSPTWRRARPMRR